MNNADRQTATRTPADVRADMEARLAASGYAGQPLLPHCTPTFGGHSPLCDRDGTYCSMASSHTGPCKPHGQPR